MNAPNSFSPSVNQQAYLELKFENCPNKLLLFYDYSSLLFSEKYIFTVLDRMYKRIK